MPCFLLVQKVDRTHPDARENIRRLKRGHVLSVRGTKHEFSQWERDNLEIVMVDDATIGEMKYLEDCEQTRFFETDPSIAKPARRVKIDIDALKRAPDSATTLAFGDRVVPVCKKARIALSEAENPEMQSMVVI